MESIHNYRGFLFRSPSPPDMLMFLCCRAQAIAIGQALVDGRWLDCVTHHDQLFRDEYALYRPLQVINPSLTSKLRARGKRYF